MDVAAARAGDRSAIDRLIAGYQPRLLAFVRLRLDDRVRAREATMDVVQSVCREVLQHAGREAQLGLIRAHPELAGKAMVSKNLTAESTNEQTQAGLTDCTPDEFERIQALNAAYNARFGFPFILAVRGPRGTGLSKQEIIATFARRVRHHPDFELAEALRELHVVDARQLVQGLVAQEEHLVLKQRGVDLVEQAVVAHGIAEIDVQQFGADGAGQLFDSHYVLSPRSLNYKNG